MERRGALRFQIELKCLVTSVGRAKVSLPGMTTDISSLVVSIATRVALHLGDRIRYSIVLGANESTILECAGQVLRTQKLVTDNRAQSSSYKTVATIARYRFIRPVGIGSDALREVSAAGKALGVGARHTSK